MPCNIWSLQVLLNQIVLGPCVIAVCFAWNNLWQGTVSELPNKYQKDALPTLLYGNNLLEAVFFLYFFGLIHGSNFGFYILTLISLQDLGSGSQSAYWISGTFFLLLLIVVRFWYFGNKELNQCLQVETLYFGRQKNHLLLLSKVVLWKSREKKLMSDHDPPTSIVSHFVSHGIKLACLPYLAYVLYSQLL